MIKSLQGKLRAQPFAEMQPSFRDTGETPMLPSARRHAAPSTTTIPILGRDRGRCHG